MILVFQFVYQCAFANPTAIVLHPTNRIASEVDLNRLLFCLPIKRLFGRLAPINK